ncbi:MAG: cell division ATP-binding protein FtsE [Alphaproteobacteria bacterium]
MAGPNVIKRGDNLVQLERIGLRYGRGPEILSGVDLELEKGAFTFLTGASGAGKSTLLSLLSLGLAPSRGLMSLFGQEVTTLPSRQKQRLKRRIGLVSQASDLIDHLNVFQNVALPLRATGGSRSAYEDDVIELLRWVGLGERLTAFPPTLSGGEKQRVAIARAVISKPDLLIADEPTGNVDPDMAQRLLRLFLEMNRGGTTVLIATHDQSLLSGITADILYLENGQLTRGVTG